MQVVRPEIRPTTLELLQQLNVGRRIAEDEQDELGDYFVETNSFRRIFNGDVDIVFGPKGSGKSAIYTSLLARQSELFDRGVTLVAGEEVRGNPAFGGILSEPPTTELEFVAIWRLYLLSLIADLLEEYDIKGEQAVKVRQAMAAAGLAKSPGGLRSLVKAVRDYVGRFFKPEAFEGGIALDPNTGLPSGVTGRIIFGEPSTAQRSAGVVSVDDLLKMADEALQAEEFSIWVLFDRLDVAFDDSRDLEANALRGLFRVYQGALGLRAIRLKIFLRNDIWRAVTDEKGFRESSHVARVLTIEWDPQSLLNLVVRRLLNNNLLVASTGVDRNEVLSNAARQREWFDTLVPDQIEGGRNPKTFEWILGRVRDGLNVVAPREVIHVLEEARDRQLAQLERGEPEPTEALLFSRAAFRDALPRVSLTRLEQTIYAEYPDLRPYLEALRSEKTNQTPRSLARLWNGNEQTALTIAQRLIEVGFFQVPSDKHAPRFKVPFLYRPALEMIQGSSE